MKRTSRAMLMAVVFAGAAFYLWYVRQGVTEPEQAFPSPLEAVAIPLCLLAVMCAAIGLVVELSLWVMARCRHNRIGKKM